ncbi:hypothetical protein ACFS4T_20240 [Pseudomonas lini]
MASGTIIQSNKSATDGDTRNHPGLIKRRARDGAEAASWARIMDVFMIIYLCGCDRRR